MANSNDQVPNQSFQCFIKLEDKIIYDFTVNATCLLEAYKLVQHSVSILIEPIREV